MNPGFEGLKIISARKDGGREGGDISYICLSNKYLFSKLIYKTVGIFGDYVEVEGTSGSRKDCRKKLVV